jgi:hypothetical protein
LTQIGKNERLDLSQRRKVRKEKNKKLRIRGWRRLGLVSREARTMDVIPGAGKKLLVLGALMSALMVGGTYVIAAGNPEIVIFRDASYCLGIPNMDVGFDGSKDYLVGPNQYLRIGAPASAHSLSFWPAIPEYIPVADIGTDHRWFSATAIRLGWRCKFEIKAITAAEAGTRTAATQEVRVSATR